MKRELLRVAHLPKSVDRSPWPSGPWDTEPDLAEWRDQATGLPCMLQRSDFSGGLCGYVGVWPEHPFFGLDMSEIDHSLSVHGGITFAGPGVVHEDGVPLFCWVLGFDCAHAFDDTPWSIKMLGAYFGDRGVAVNMITRTLRKTQTRYWTIDMVMDEVDRLARQLHELLQRAKGERQLPPGLGDDVLPSNDRLLE